MNEQLSLEDEFICDGCEAHAFGHHGKIPDGWKVFGQARLCGRKSGSRWSEVVELHHCVECQHDESAGDYRRQIRRMRNLGRVG